MDGLLIIDKPAGMTSHDVVAHVRRIFKTRRVGHTGTLDPFATGVLIVLVGKATRLARFLETDAKEYEAVVTFGYETDTGDRTGLRRQPPGDAGLKSVESDDIARVISRFKGQIKQTPPMYSAKKVGGKKLYELAREGKEVERKPVDVTIYELELLPGQVPSEQGTFSRRFRIKCSAGTYIRTLAEEIGRELGSGAHVGELRRTAAGKFGIDRAVTLDDLSQSSDPMSFLLPMSEALDSMPEFPVTEGRIERTLQGLSTRTAPGAFAEGQCVKMMGENGELLAIGEFRQDKNEVKPIIVLG